MLTLFIKLSELDVFIFHSLYTILNKNEARLAARIFVYDKKNYIKKEPGAGENKRY